MIQSSISKMRNIFEEFVENDENLKPSPKIQNVEFWKKNQMNDNTSRYPVTCAGLCGLVEGWVPVDASSGCPIIDWAVETRRWGAGWWPWWCLGGDMPHYIEIAIVLMNWLITLYCFYLLFFFTNNCCFSIKVCHVLLCMSRNTGQINPAGFQSLKYMYYTHVIMTIKWFLTLTLTLTSILIFIMWCDQNHLGRQGFNNTWDLHVFH